jgi:sigma-B regulation protein RsbU (phosphoserine phosphatase)
MVMAAVKTALLRAVHTTSDPGELLRQVNDELYEMLLGECFVTAVCARLDPAGRRVDLALAAHVNPLHVRPTDGQVCRLGDRGLPLGVQSGTTFPAVSCPFAPGDALVFLTDGVLEAANSQGEFFGVERLLDLVRRHVHAEPAALVRAIEAHLHSHVQAHEQGDDQTVLVVQAMPAREQEPAG